MSIALLKIRFHREIDGKPNIIFHDKIVLRHIIEVGQGTIETHIRGMSSQKRPRQASVRKSDVRVGINVVTPGGLF